jgi:hypothetical protein
VTASPLSKGSYKNGFGRDAVEIVVVLLGVGLKQALPLWGRGEAAQWRAGYSSGSFLPSAHARPRVQYKGWAVSKGSRPSFYATRIDWLASLPLQSTAKSELPV